MLVRGGFNMVNLLICGIGGRIGRFVYESATERGINVVCGVDKLTGGGFDCPVYKGFDEVKELVDCVIDFSLPEGTEEALSFALSRRCALVIGTTGHSEKQEEEIRKAALNIPVFKSGNMSIGMSLIRELCRIAAGTLPDYDVEIVETHHGKKIDSPSGTTFMLVDALEKGLQEKRNLVFGRSGSRVRNKDEIGIHSVRGGSVTGEHEILFLGDSETITISHSALTKKLFADGALVAAEFVTGRSAGFYTMDSLFSPDGFRYR